MLIAIIPSINLIGQDTFEDDFNGGLDYSNSSGNQTWTTSWIESGETTNPDTGRMRIRNNQLRFRNLDGRSISRTIDLSSYTGFPVVLTLDFNRTFGNETIDIELLNNLGVWELVDTTGGTGSIVYTLTANQIHAASAIRLISGSGDWNNNSETVFIDNIQFEASQFIITDGVTITTCNDTFIDSGGTGGNYSNNESITYTICPDTSGSSLIANFTSFDVETFWDGLSIYEGTATTTLIGTFDNANVPTTITSSDPSGCLTFVFTSDNTVSGTGWVANLTCTAPSTPEITINDVSVNENTGTLDFAVSHTGGTTTGSFTIEYATVNNTAVAPGDYNATGSPNPTITFPGTSLSTQTISIPIVDDNIAETSETFFVNLSNPSDGSVSITDTQGIGTINASDPASIAINDISVNESAGTASFTVTASGGSVTGGYTVDYATADNSATTASNDYTNTSSPPSLSFNGTIGETETITVPILEDTIIEGNETYFVNISNVSSSLVSINDNQGLGTIVDNDASISINDITVNENVGNATFTVTLMGTVSGGFTVDYDTANNTATTPEDYTGTGSPSPSLTFAGTDGETQTITIPIINDNFVETATENFFVNLSNASSGIVTITDSQGIGTITDNDVASIAINDVSVNETVGTATFTVTHSGGGDVSGGFTVEYATANSSATSPNDYTSTGSPNPTLTFSGTNGETQTIIIPIINDTDIEGTETYFINLSNLSNTLVTISDTQGLGTIIDDEAPFIITDLVTDNTCSGIFVDSGSINGQYSNNEAITYTLCPDTAGSSIVLNFTSFDVEAGFDALSIYQGTTTTTLIGTFDNNTIPTSIISTDPSGCLTFVFTSDGSITGNGWQASISCSAANTFVTVNNVTVNENAGTAIFTATHTGASVPGGFTVNYTTEDNTAFADSDFTTTTGTLNFSGTSGQSLTITVPIINNIFGENTETFFVNLNNSSSASVGLINGIGTILDDSDPALPSNVPLALFDDFNGYYDYASTGGSFRVSDANTCTITSSSSNTLTTSILPGGSIEKAYLIWAHSGSNADDVVTFEGQMVSADIVNRATFGTREFHSMVSDVTSIVQGIADPSTNVYDVTDLSIDNTGNHCSFNTTLGGWSLMVFYTESTLPAVTINMYNGFNGQQNNTTNYTLSGFFAIGSTGSKTTILSWEGDQGLATGELLSVTTGSGTFNLNGDGDNDGTTLNNPFNGTIFDNTVIPNINTFPTFGIDLDTYDISPFINQGESTATTNVQAGNDFVLLNSVLLKVPSNLMTGTVFEDVNYPGGAGRNQATSSGVGIEGVRVELYNNLGVLEDFDITDVNGDYNIGGMANGTYSLRVVNNTVNSTRGGGTTCTNCLPVQTFRSSFASSTLTPITNEIGGANPSAQDVAANILIGAQTVSSMTILNEGAVDIDFGFNFNTIVNTNTSGQGSLEQFIINANNLDETGLNIEANSIFNPATGEDTSIFMIPPTSDPLGRTADINFGSGFFNIDLNGGSSLSAITAENTHIDGRTQTAYSGDTNTGNITPAVSNVGVSANPLPNYNLPEIQIDGSTLGDVFTVQASGTTIRNTAIFASGNIGIQNTSGSNLSPVIITENLIGVNADGIVATRLTRGIRVSGGAITQIVNNYISENTSTGISINGGTATTIEYNTLESNGTNSCADGIELGSGTGVTIQNNLINNTAAIGIEGWQYPGDVVINENTITNSGQNGGICSGSVESNGIRLYGNNSSITSNIIANSGGAGVVITGGNTSGNLISQNSIYANGILGQALGIDIDQSTTGNPVGDGVTINDNGDTDTGPNGSLNFPEFESATISGTTLRVVGWARPGATIEFFVTDINQGTATAGDNQLGLTQDYGEGQIYIGSATEGSANDLDATTSSYSDADGNTDNTNRFSFNITLNSAIPVGSIITATATVSNSTSEFGNTFPLSAATIITNRKITYRIKPN